jgi:hypothetical protein
VDGDSDDRFAFGFMRQISGLSRQESTGSHLEMGQPVHALGTGAGKTISPQHK